MPRPTAAEVRQTVSDAAYAIMPRSTAPPSFDRVISAVAAAVCLMLDHQESDDA